MEPGPQHTLPWWKYQMFYVQSGQLNRFLTANVAAMRRWLAGAPGRMGITPTPGCSLRPTRAQKKDMQTGRLGRSDRWEAGESSLWYRPRSKPQLTASFCPACYKNHYGIAGSHMEQSISSCSGDWKVQDPDRGGGIVWWGPCSGSQMVSSCCVFTWWKVQSHSLDLLWVY